MNDLYVEPFLGEFGWELFGWQSILRAMSDVYSIRVWCKPGHNYLYRDFAQAVHTFDLGHMSRIATKFQAVGLLSGHTLTVNG